MDNEVKPHRCVNHPIGQLALWLRAKRLWLVPAFIFLAVSLVYGVRFYTAPLSHDEQHYVSAGVLVRDMDLYRDIPYFQAPYLPYLYQALFAVTGGGPFLLKARYLTFLLLLIGGWCFYGVLVRLSSSPRFSLLLLFLVSVSGILFSSSGWADNNVPAMVFFWGGLLAVLRAQDTGSRLGSFISGLLLMAAAGIKLFYIVLLVPLGVFILASRSLRPVSFFWLLGLIVGAAPALAAALSCPADFVFGNWQFHRLTAEMYTAQGRAEMIHWRTAAHFIKRSLLYDPSNAGLALMVLMGCCRIPPLTGKMPSDRLWLALGLSLTAVAALLFLKPLFVQHLLLLLGCLVLIPAAAWRDLPEVQKKAFNVLGYMVCLLSLWSGASGIFMAAGKAGESPMVTMAAADAAIRDAGVRPGSRAATLAPLAALESGLTVYPQLATGPFLYRLAPGTMRDRQWQDPAPMVIITGFEPELDVPFDAWARAGGYRRNDAGMARIYVRAQ